MFLLADTITMQWADWALSRGTQGVLMLGCMLLVSMVIRLHKEKNQLHKDSSKREKEFQTQLTTQADAARLRLDELEADFRVKIEQLLREQVKIAKETSRVLVLATDVLRSLKIVDGEVSESGDAQ